MTEHPPPSSALAWDDKPYLADRHDDENRPPWLTLICGYLIVYGSVMVLTIIFRQFGQYHFIWSIRRFWKDPNGEGLRGWLLHLSFLSSHLTPIAALATGVLVVSRPSRLAHLAIQIALLMLMDGVLGAALNLSSFMTEPVFLQLMHWTLCTFLLLKLVPPIILPIFVLSFVRRSSEFQRPTIKLIVGYLVIIGAIGFFAFVVLYFGQVARGVGRLLSPRQGWTESHVSVVARQMYPVALLACGLVLWKRPGRVVAVAGTIAFATLISTAMRIPALRYAFTESHSVLDRIGVYLRELIYPLILAAFFLAFAIRFRHRLGPNHSICRKCGYNLTGNVSGRCPECGAETSSARRSSPCCP